MMNNQDLSSKTHPHSPSTSAPLLADESCRRPNYDVVAGRCGEPRNRGDVLTGAIKLIFSRAIIDENDK
jgi:hypothetical protein